MILFYIALFAILNVIYQLGFFGTSILLNLTEQHYQFGKRIPWLRFSVRGVTFSIATYFPFPGLVKIYTIVNGEQQPMKYPWEFHQATIMKRLVATISGVVTLLLTSIVLFTTWIHMDGETEITKAEVNRLGIYPSEQAVQAGFQKGDQIIALNGQDYNYYSDLIKPQMLFGDRTYYTVLRGGKEIRIDLHGSPEELMNSRYPFLMLLAPFEVSGIKPNSPAEVAGIELGDRIVKVNDEAVIKYLDMQKAFDADDDGIVSLEIERRSGNDLRSIHTTVTLNDSRRLDIGIQELINYTLIGNTFFQSIAKTPSFAGQLMKVELRAFVRLFTGIIPQKSSGGPIRFQENVVPYFLSIGAGKAAMYGVIWNVLPLPQAIFWEIIALLYASVTRKEYRRVWYDRTQRISSIIVKVLVVLGFVSIFAIDIFRALG